MTQAQEKATFDPRLTEIVSYGIFNNRDILVRTGSCPRRDLQFQTKDGETVKEGNYTWKRDPIKMGYRMRRKNAYPSVGDQLGAICDLAKTIRDGSDIDLPDSVLEWIETIDRVKSQIPKRDDI